MGRHTKDGHYVRGNEWKRLNNKHFACQCHKCGKVGMKSEMPGLYLRKPNDSHRILCRFCLGCLPRCLDELGVKMPE